jgi:hypothetical protein
VTTTRTVCDVCGKEKGETNHWWRINSIAGSISLEPAESSDKPVFGVLPANLPTVCEKRTLDLCGQSCVLKMVSEFMGTLR